MAVHLLTTLEPLPFKPPAPPFSPSLHLLRSSEFTFTWKKAILPLRLTLSRRTPPPIKASSTSTAAADVQIDMVRSKDGIYTPKPKKVVVLWDLDNKPPRGPPYQAALALKKVAESFGELVDISAYANRHAFIHLPHWVREERREKRNLEFLERKGIVTPLEPYVCSVCGRKCKTQLDLKKHFKQLHERERQKKLNRMKQLKGKKRQRFKERFINGNDKYAEAARTLITPKTGYGLASELKRAGVWVKTVEDKPQAADWAVKKQMQHSMSRGIDWLFLVSDDSDFLDMLRRAREANLGTVVVGDWDRALGREADLWVPWAGVENGSIKEEDLLPKVGRNREFDADENMHHHHSSSIFNDEEAADRNEYDGVRMSAFSEGEDEEYGLDVEDSELDSLLDDDEGGEDDDFYFF